MFRHRQVVYLGAIILAFIVVLGVGTALRTAVNSGSGMVVAPASLDGVVTMSTSGDHKLTFITCAPLHPALLQRFFHSNLSGAFVVQHSMPASNISFHSGIAHIDFQGDLLRITFADSSRFVFTTRPAGSIPINGENVDYPIGIASYGATWLGTHAEFVASQTRPS